MSTNSQTSLNSYHTGERDIWRKKAIITALDTRATIPEIKELILSLNGGRANGVIAKISEKVDQLKTINGINGLTAWMIQEQFRTLKMTSRSENERFLGILDVIQRKRIMIQNALEPKLP